MSLSVSQNKEIVITDSPAVTRAKRLKRSVITTARVIQESLNMRGHRFKVAMVTLTYRDDDMWRANHISAYLDNVRKWARRGGCSVVKRGRRKKNLKKFTSFNLRYVFVAELTKRGRVHYHVLFWLPRGVTMPMADRQGWWKHGSTKSEWARKPVGYIAKYASKGTQYDSSIKSFPKYCRIQGSGGLDKLMLDWKNWILCPAWLKTMLDDQQFSVRKKCSYWVVEKMCCYRSPWFYDFIQRKLIFTGIKLIQLYDEVFPKYQKSDFDFSTNLVKFEPADSKYLIQNRSDVLNFQDAVSAVEISSYYEAIDRAMFEIQSRDDAFALGMLPPGAK